MTTPTQMPESLKVPEELAAIRDALPNAIWTGRWYDAGCNTVMCDYGGKPGPEHDEIAHPVPLGVDMFLAAVNPAGMTAVLAYVDALQSALKDRDAEIERLKKDAERPISEQEKHRLNPYRMSGSAKSIWLNGFNAAEHAHNIKHDVSAAEKAFGALAIDSMKGGAT